MNAILLAPQRSAILFVARMGGAAELRQAADGDVAVTAAAAEGLSMESHSPFVGGTRPHLKTAALQALVQLLLRRLKSEKTQSSSEEARATP